MVKGRGAPRCVLYVISCLRIGGGEHQLVEFLRTIDRRRWRPLVACLEKVRVLPQGIDLPRFDAQATADSGLPPWNGPTVVTVANMLGPQKGHDDLLDAATQLPDVRFVWCGDGAYRPTLERRAAELGVADR